MIADIPDHISPDHCLITQQYAVYTKPIKEMADTLVTWINQGRPGGYIFGASRLGKTRCIQWFLEELLTEQLGWSIPLLVWNHRADSHTSEVVFWQTILKSSKFNFGDKPRTMRKQDVYELVKARLVSLAENAKHNHVILLIDEAQDLRDKEWRWLMGLQNDLDYLGYVLSVFSVGTQQLHYRQQMIAKSQDAHIAARFLAADAQFHGIRTRKELEDVLQGYDEYSRWPPESDISYLEGFAPDYFAKGNRLSNHAETFWKLLVHFGPRMLRGNEFPMQHIARTIENLLFDLARGGMWERVLSEINIEKHLKSTNFQTHMRIISSSLSAQEKEDK